MSRYGITKYEISSRLMKNGVCRGAKPHCRESEGVPQPQILPPSCPGRGSGGWSSRWPSGRGRASDASDSDTYVGGQGKRHLPLLGESREGGALFGRSLGVPPRFIISPSPLASKRGTQGVRLLEWLLDTENHSSDTAAGEDGRQDEGDQPSANNAQGGWR